MRINKTCFGSGMYGAVIAFLLLFCIKSCGGVMVDSIEKRGRHIVCMEVIEKDVYQKLEACK